MMRDAAFAVIREIGVETGGSTFSSPCILKRPHGRD
jgi:carbamoylphosphate synthase large subunit